MPLVLRRRQSWRRRSALATSARSSVAQPGRTSTTSRSTAPSSRSASHRRVPSRRSAVSSASPPGYRR